MSQRNKRAAAAEVFRQQNMITEVASAAFPAQAEGGEHDSFADDYSSFDDAGLLDNEEDSFSDQAPAGGFSGGSLNAPPPPPMPKPTTVPSPAPSIYPQQAKKTMSYPVSSLKTSEELQLEKEPIQVRETGFWLWKRVVVPPNAYVVHTRIGKQEPVTLGLGVSFRYNPATDAYLVVPAAMQTIGVVANCITSEKQGINVLAYVQWQISDFSVAYRKLDISDPRDPLGIVNAQLREQAEAAIKDKISTMGVEEVLTDKALIIEELTRRLSEVTEGRSQSVDSERGQGLGIKIVTVQIKEARVSSQRLWENLQAPFRHEQEKAARLSYLQMQEELRSRELDTRKVTETSEAEAQVEIARIKQSKQTEGLQVRLEEEEKRFAREQTTRRQQIQLEEDTTLVAEESQRRLAAERARREQEMNLARLEREQQEALERTRLEAESEAQQNALRIEQKLREMTDEQRLAAEQATLEQARLQRELLLKQAEHDYLTQSGTLENQRMAQALLERLEREQQEALAKLELDRAKLQIQFERQERDAQIARLHQEIRNLMNDRDLQRILIEKLPEISQNMPEIHEMRVLQTGDNQSGLADFITQLLVAFATARTVLKNDVNPNTDEG
jgi:regulator of protease activity HflC (stomatin/prohibitin superfamily)